VPEVWRYTYIYLFYLTPQRIGRTFLVNFLAELSKTFQFQAAETRVDLEKGRIGLLKRISHNIVTKVSKRALTEGRRRQGARMPQEAHHRLTDGQKESNAQCKSSYMG
jgi:hypothetical protein